jgi:hypothetical protein
MGLMHEMMTDAAFAHLVLVLAASAPIAFAATFLLTCAGVIFNE